MDRYEIHIGNDISDRKASGLGFAGRSRLPDGGSRLVAIVPDQAALYGLLARLRDAGLELVALGRLTDGPVAPCAATAPSTTSKEGA